MQKVFYDADYLVMGVYDLDFDQTQYPPFDTLPFVIATIPDLIEITIADPEDPTILERTGQYKFPFDDIVLLKKIAVQTVDYMVQMKQDNGYTHTNGKVYSSTERARGMLLGKIQEVTVLGLTSNILYPDINEAGVLHTDTEIKDVGVKMAQYIEGIFVSGATLKAQINDPSVTTLIQLEQLLINGV